MTTTKTVTVTPDVAVKWLEQNTCNRPVSPSTVRDYAAQMKAGKWILNGEAIIFSEKKVLLDGQHRLWACIESESDFETVVVYGITDDAFATIDTGKKRSAADVLAIAGHAHNRFTVAAAANFVLTYQRGMMLSKLPVPRQDVLEFVERNPEIADWAKAARAAKGWTSSYASSLAGVGFLAAHKHPQKAQEFVRKFCTGEDLQPGSPVLALRNRLGTEKHMPKVNRHALIVQAWNAFVAGRGLARMQMPRLDTFPDIAGAPAKKK